VDDFIRLLVDSVASGPNPATQEKPGMFGRLLGAGRKEKQPDEPAAPLLSPNRLLLELLQRLRWPSRLDEDIRRLREQLKAESEKETAWLKTIEALTQLYGGALGAAEGDLHDTEHYLAQLNQRLQELDSVIQQMDNITSNSKADQDQLRQSLGGELGGVRQEVQEANDLDSFKQLLDKRLDAIQNQVENHLRNEEAHLNAVTQEAAQLRERLGDLEANGEKLLQRLEEIQTQALTDPLTGLPNRGAYEQRVIEEFARWKRFGKPLTMLVWDIDRFKSINDNFGHQVGDKVLQAIAKLLSERIRATDFVGRYGGEEFVMLMPGSTAEQAGQVANEIRKGIAAKSFRAGAKDLPITISCGYAAVSEGDEPEAVFKRADEALYRAKENGRNRCELGE
jgi:diguanylate cyclase